MKAWLGRLWYQRPSSPLWLRPLSGLFRCVIAIRRALFERGLLQRHQVALPVIVVGNITVGGSGKTPMVLGLVQLLQQEGLRVAVISRGYGGTYDTMVHQVTEQCSVACVGDEPKMLHSKTGVPVILARKRFLAASYVQVHDLADVIVADDGLQHYALQRDIEIVMIDGTRQFGNGALLPAGPLREPLSRLQQADYLVTQGGKPYLKSHHLTLDWQALVPLAPELDGTELPEYCAVVGMAGIADPSRFQTTLTRQGYQVQSFYPFADHQAYSLALLAPVLQSGLPILMTEKDAIKCQSLPDVVKKRMFVVCMQTRLPSLFQQQLLTQLRSLIDGHGQKTV
jgi:tetraacyldisaccharide 4'-kinase